MSKEILIFPRGQLSPKDKERLTKAGILAIEADTPHQVVRLDLTPAMRLEQSVVTGDAIVSSLLQALASQEAYNSGGVVTSVGRASHHFVKALAKACQPKATP